MCPSPSKITFICPRFSSRKFLCLIFSHILAKQWHSHGCQIGPDGKVDLMALPFQCLHFQIFCYPFLCPNLLILSTHSHIKMHVPLHEGVLNCKNKNLHVSMELCCWTSSYNLQELVFWCFFFFKKKTETKRACKWFI